MSGFVKTLGIIGAGTMGRGIAQSAVTAGLEVRLYDLSADAVDDALGFVEKMITRAVEKNRMTEADAKAAVARLNRAEDLQSFSGCQLVIEAIAENLEIKQKLFRQLEDIIDAGAILASNTSSLSISAIASACARPGQVAGFHFFNPVPLMRLVEVVKGLRTAPEVTGHLVTLAEQMSKTPVVVADSPGFLVNHAGRGYNTEALRVLSEQIADEPTIDMILRDGVGFRMGPFELLDVTGLDVSHPVMEQIYQQYYAEQRYRPQPLTGRRMAAGLLGRKTNEGFYRYQDGKRVEETARRPKGDGDRISSAYLTAGAHDAGGLLLEELKRRKIAQAGSVADADICVVMPFGSDCTTAALEAELPPEKTVAVDPCSGFDGSPILDRLAVVMTNPATDTALAENFGSLLDQDTRPCVLINDSPGFVAQRVLAQIVNIGCDIAQQGIAAPKDIDIAVELGLGYPKGPLAAGDLIGPDKCALILNQLAAFYGDPRYRLSPWLKRRALLKMSLTA